MPLSEPTYHALHLVARIDRMAPAEIVEALVAAYLEKRLRAIHEGGDEVARGHVIDLAARRKRRAPSERPRGHNRSRVRRGDYSRPDGEPRVGVGDD